jgi:NitT/TauT family transport system ATP-binding protein
MTQRIAIARTLVLDPDIVLIHEPFGALDEQTRVILGTELLRIWRETGLGMLFMTRKFSIS